MENNDESDENGYNKKIHTYPTDGYGDLGPLYASRDLIPGQNNFSDETKDMGCVCSQVACVTASVLPLLWICTPIYCSGITNSCIVRHREIYRTERCICENNDMFRTSGTPGKNVVEDGVQKDIWHLKGDLLALIELVKSVKSAKGYCEECNGFRKRTANIAPEKQTKNKKQADAEKARSIVDNTLVLFPYSIDDDDIITDEYLEKLIWAEKVLKKEYDFGKKESMARLKDLDQSWLNAKKKHSHKQE